MLNFHNKLKIILGFILISTFFLILPNYYTVSAQKSQNILEISPLIFNISLDPGKEYNYELNIKNLTNTPLPVKAYFENFTTTDEDGGYVFDNKPNPLISWSKISPEDMIIPAKETKKIDLKINIPNKVPFGGYYGVLFIEPLAGKKLNDNTLVSAKVGALLLANIGSGSENKAQIIEFKTNKLSEKDELEVLLRVRNDGLNHFSAKPFLTLKPLIGNKETIELEEKFVFPGKVRRWEQKVKIPNKWLGIYNAEIAVSTGNGKQVIENSLFISFPASKAILILLIISVVGFIIIKRQRVKKALTILIKNKS